MSKKFYVGDMVIVGNRAGRIDDFDEEDNTYRVSFNDTDFDWFAKGDING